MEKRPDRCGKFTAILPLYTSFMYEQATAKYITLDN